MGSKLYRYVFVMDGLTRTMLDGMDVQADLSLCWSYKSYCMFYQELPHFIISSVSVPQCCG